MEFEWVMCFTASQAEKNSCTLFLLSFQCTGGMERTSWVDVGGERERCSRILEHQLDCIS